MRKNDKRAIAIFVVFLLALVAFYVPISGGERLCWWNPAIDTVYAPNYSESGFDSIKNGMTQHEVISLIGEPFSKGQIPIGSTSYLKPTTSEEWLYTGDGKCKWADWAWLGRWVGFDDNGIVTETNKIVHHD